MKIAQILRKCDPEEWAGTETAVLNLAESLRQNGIDSTIYCPQIPNFKTDPFLQAEFEVKRVRSILPYWGLTDEKRKRLISIGGNFLSMDLLRMLWQAKDTSVIHTHALGIFGGSALTLARFKKIPFIVSIHGGVLDLPRDAESNLSKPLEETFMWGRPFSWLLNARNVLRAADLILTCNSREAELLRLKFPSQKVIVNPHAIDTALYDQDWRHEFAKAFPKLANAPILLMVGRIDPVKNQLWLIEQLPPLLIIMPTLKLLLLGPITDKTYETLLKKRIRELKLEHSIKFMGEIPNNHPLYKGLLQSAKALILPSISETFGIAILEAWAAGTPVFASGTSGAKSLIEEEKTGWLFELNTPKNFQEMLIKNIESSSCATVTHQAKQHVKDNYDLKVLGIRMKNIYEALIEGRKDEISDFTRR